MKVIIRYILCLAFITQSSFAVDLPCAPLWDWANAMCTLKCNSELNPSGALNVLGTAMVIDCNIDEEENCVGDISCLCTINGISNTSFKYFPCNKRARKGSNSSRCFNPENPIQM
jgi:hypothetical protein